MSEATCGVRRTGWSYAGLPCVLTLGHTGDHRDAMLDTFATPIGKARVTRDQWEAQCAADEAELLRAVEWHRVEKSLAALYRARFTGDTSLLTQQKIDRWERVQQAMMGSPEALAG